MPMMANVGCDAISANARIEDIARRHLDTAAKRALIEAELKDRPDVSNRAIAQGLGASHPTIAAVRKRLEAGGKIFHYDNTRGNDGVVQPTKKVLSPILAVATLPGIEPEGTAADIFAKAWEISPLSQGASSCVACRSITVAMRRRRSTTSPGSAPCSTVMTTHGSSLEPTWLDICRVIIPDRDKL